MKNNRGLSLIEIIISISLLSLIMLFLFRLLIIVRNEDSLNVHKLNVNTLASLMISDIHDDFNSKGLKYVYKPTCIDLTAVQTNCCCSRGSYDCLKFYYKTGEIKELSVYQTNSFNDSIKYGDIKRVLPKNHSFLDFNAYNMTTNNKFQIETIGDGEFLSTPAGTGYIVDSLITVNIPIFRIGSKTTAIEIREGYSFEKIASDYFPDGNIVRPSCPNP